MQIAPTPEEAHPRHRLITVEGGARQCDNTVGRLHKRHHQRKALMFHNALEKEGGSPAHTLPPSHPITDDPLRFELREHVRKLRLILPVISVSIMALHRQNAELDYVSLPC
jgi:hypothetical protein